MATWIAHLRIAEKLLDQYKIDKNMFLAGNVGPDCGVPNEDWSDFTPPKQSTHWTNEQGTIDPEEFYKNYIEGRKLEDIQEFSFLLGYYVHLLTDVQWSRMFKEQINADKELKERLEKDKKYIWKVKEDWYGVDFSFIYDNKESIFNEFMKVTTVKDYLDYFPKEAFTKRIAYIKGFYNTDEKVKPSTGRYFSNTDMDNFIERTSIKIADTLNCKGIFQQLAK